MDPVMSKLIDQIAQKNSRVCVGLDPTVKVVPEKFFYEEFGYERVLNDCGVFDYCVAIIDAVKDVVPVVKPNIAFFEAIGANEIFLNVCKYAKEKGLIVIGDVKRADIGSTSSMYAKAYLHEDSPIDFITINPYFGTDSIIPFVDMANKNGKGIFVLVKTSNDSSSEIQDMVLANGDKVYEHVGKLVKKWGENETGGNQFYNSVGAVVGATHPNDAKKLREQMPNTWFLVPGYGAQGATAADVAVNFDHNGMGAIVNASRSIIGAWKEPEYKDMSLSEAAYAAAVKMRDEINKII